MEQCNHVIGMREAQFPQHGETDRLICMGESADFDGLHFSYCPLCGVSLAGLPAATHTPEEIGKVEYPMSLGTIYTERQLEDLITVPREPTPEMIEAAWAEAHDENAVGVWRDMIAAYEGRRTSEGVTVALTPHP